MTTNHKQALEILSPMHADFDSYMFEPEVGGFIRFYNGYRKHRTFEFIYRANNWQFMTERGGWHCNWKKSYKNYIPTDRQLWAEILKFNDEQDKLMRKQDIYSYYIVDVDTLFKNATLNDFTHPEEKRQSLKVGFTDADTLYLALLKICVEIWKIRQESDNA